MSMCGCDLLKEIRHSVSVVNIYTTKADTIFHQQRKQVGSSLVHIITKTMQALRSIWNTV